MADPPLVVEIFDCLVNGGIEHDSVLEGLMGEMMTLQIPPAQFDVIEFRRVTRQPLDGDLVPRGKRGGAGLRGVGRSLSSTRTTGFVFRRGLGPKRSSSFSSKAMKSVLRFVAEVWTMSSRVVASSTPIIATFRACPGAATRGSAPRLAQAWAR